MNRFHKKFPAIPLRDIHLLMQNLFPDKDEDKYSDAEQKMMESLLFRRVNGEPVQRILGEWEFWSLSFKLNHATLVPRPDTETIIEAVLKNYNSATPLQILDLGTGSGCILIALLHEYQYAKGLGVDIAVDAVRMAQKNAVRNNVYKRAEFICGSWTDSLRAKYDVIVSNPPYIPSDDIEHLSTEVKKFDPLRALDGGQSGFDSIDLLLSKITTCLNENGLAFIEIGHDQADTFAQKIEQTELQLRNVHYDLNKHARVMALEKKQ